MPGREYVCGECGHQFRTPDDMPRNAPALMCPSCGSVDLMIVVVPRPRPVVMRAKGAAPADSRARAGENEAQ